MVVEQRNAPEMRLHIESEYSSEGVATVALFFASETCRTKHQTPILYDVT